MNTQKIFKFTNDSAFTSSKQHYNQDKLLFKKYARNVPEGTNTVVSKQTFETNFDLVTSNLFLCMNWDNMVIAGGSVLALMTKSTIETKDFSDFDIFLYGLSNRGYNKKVIEIYNALKQVYNKEIVTNRTRRAITFVCGNGIKHIQIIIKDHLNISDIIDSFDLLSVVTNSDISILKLMNSYESSLYYEAVKLLATQTCMTDKGETYKYAIAKVMQCIMNNSSNYHEYVFKLFKDNERTLEYIENNIEDIIKTVIINDHEQQMNDYSKYLTNNMEKLHHY